MVEPTRAGWTVALACAACAACAACSARGPEDRVARVADPPRPAAVAPAGPAPVDAPGPDAAGAPMIDPELDLHLGGLAGEHAAGVEPSIAWLVAHPGRARPALRAIVDARRDDVRTVRALIALAAIGDVDDIAVLAAALREAGTDTLRWAAAKALRDHGRPEAVAALIDAARGPAPAVAGAAATMLGERKAEAARAVLEALLDHADPGTRYRAVRALGALGAGASAAALRRRTAVETDADVKAALAAVGHR